MPTLPQSGPLLSGTLSAFGHGLGALGTGITALSAVLSLTDPSPASLTVAAVGATAGLPLMALYALTLGRILRRRPLTMHLSVDAETLILRFTCGKHALRTVCYRLSEITDCGLTPVDSGFSSLWRPYLGFGQPPRRRPLPLSCRADLRRIPPEQFEALLAATVTLLAQHQPQALFRLHRDGAAYG
ncbi:hypothetical protein [Novispirillum itersonii]|uniref:Uncharacterized protein n=1 Tax=Novispirillum itersonii TaxID=189 RepID=A0A7X0DP30_NOVIT|nr:hypothetical protein [Novispirillum itersonii]MBB6210827.1 hypothetical protein [Novispirillum itersonii]